MKRLRMKQLRWKRRKQRGTRLIPATKVRLGDRVFHRHVFWWQGMEHHNWELAVVELLSRDGLVGIETVYGYSRKVGLSTLFIEKA